MEVEPKSLDRVPESESDRVPESESDAMINNILYRESLGFAAVACSAIGGQTVKLVAKRDEAKTGAKDNASLTRKPALQA